MPRSPIPHLAKMIRVGLSYELPNDYAEHDNGNLSNLDPSAVQRISRGPARAFPACQKTFHSKVFRLDETPWPSIECVAWLTVSLEICISRGS